MRILTIFVCLWSVLASAAHADEAIFSAESTHPDLGHKAIVIVMPDAAKEATNDWDHDNGWVSVNLQLGELVGIRAQFMPYETENYSIAVEGFAGGMYSTIGFGGAFAGGVRVKFNAAHDASNKNFFIVSPGADFIVMKGEPPSPGWFSLHFAPYSDIYFIATNADLSYLHKFSKHFGFEVGFQGGVGLAVAGTEDNNHHDPKGHIIIQAGLFTGLRF